MPRRPLLLSCLLLSLTGCINRTSQESTASETVIEEGVIYSVEYLLPDGRTGGFTRLDLKEAVPGRNGSWNVDAYGKLTPDFLLVTYPKWKGVQTHAIPVHRLIGVQFGTGGIGSIKKGGSPYLNHISG